MATAKKEQVVEEIKDKLSNSESLFFTDYKGLTVAELSDLRGQLRKEGVEYKILKNTLLNIAFGDKTSDELKAILEGPTAVAFAPENSPAVAKILNNYAKTQKQFSIKAAYMEGALLSAETVKELANVPPREVLIAKLLGSFQSPISKFVRVINNPVQNLVYALDAVAKTKN